MAKNGARFVVVAAAEGLIAWVAVEVVKQTVTDQHLRDWFIVLIWPFVLILGLFAFWLWLRAGSADSQVDAANPAVPLHAPTPSLSTEEAQRLARFERQQAMQRWNEEVKRARQRVNDVMGANTPHDTADVWWTNQNTYENEVLDNLIGDAEKDREFYTRKIDDEFYSAAASWKERLAIRNRILAERLSQIMNRRGFI